ncbi:hypothetical protein MCUN1_000260 [Malassezia cuniculi]|uniref:50S ribosomal protein L35 n=1 Tax=Malassezia cuniculi TaxID=948313 RepID=A0AAF0J4H2_9BASI|nr:hypothetical protein MCUN1_000260 [Malassezia cuniculi]
MFLFSRLAGAAVARVPLAPALARAAPMQIAPIHASAVSLVAPRPAVRRTKLKTHGGTKKRIFPILGSGNKASQIKFKCTRPNKQHLNSNMSRVRLNRLGGTTVVRSGPVARMLRRLLAPRL